MREMEPDNVHLFIKISGLVLGNPAIKGKLTRYLSSYLSKFHDHECHVIIGGGNRVDAFRKWYAENPRKLHEIWKEKGERDTDTNTIAHWLAIEAMQKNVEEIKREFPQEKGIHFPPVFTILKEHPSALPVSWNVTSDSIAYWLAHNSGLKKENLFIVLLKPIDGVIATKSENGIISRRRAEVEGTIVEEITVKESRPSPKLASYPFDEYLFTLVEKYKTPVHVINFNYPERVEAITDGAELNSTICTKIKYVG